jgi:glycosyltransferase involved in cell wall biosynthesis
MPTLLHLISTGADSQTRSVHQALCDKLGDGFVHSTRTVGNGGDCRHLPALVAAARRSPADVVCCWGTTAVVAAVLAGRRRIVYSPDRPVGPNRLRWVRAVTAGRNVTAVWPTETQSRIAAAAGLHPARSFVIRPGVDFGAIGPRDGAIRAALGWSPDDFVLLAPGESDPRSGHEMAVWTCGILNQLSERYKLLTWGRGRSSPRVESMSRRLHLSEMTRTAETALNRPVRFEEILSAADVALVTAAGVVPTLPIAQCMAAGLPIVTTATGSVAELVRDGQTGSVVPTRSPRALARRVLDVQADAALRWKLSGNARADAYERLSVSQMIRRYRALLNQVAEDRPVDPESVADPEKS